MLLRSSNTPDSLWIRAPEGSCTMETVKRPSSTFKTHLVHHSAPSQTVPEAR